MLANNGSLAHLVQSIRNKQEGQVSYMIELRGVKKTDCSEISKYVSRKA